ncbi:MAG: hypothetical protein Kow0099_19090 [Candidatus Abyssubacteria bacterium]
MGRGSRRQAGRVVAGVSWMLLALGACQTMRAAGPTFDIRVRHISDYTAYEDHTVHLGEQFYIADTLYTVEVQEFIPDFVIDMKTRKVKSRSDKPLNPALRLAVSYQEDLLYETWILYQNLIPHVIYEPGYYFQFISYEGFKK